MIFVLGCGNVGALVALALRRASAANVVLVLSGQRRLEQFQHNGSTLSIAYPNRNVPAVTSTFDAVTVQQLASVSKEHSLVELFRRSSGSVAAAGRNRPAADSASTAIDNLVVATKAHQTLDALIPIMHLIGSSTNVVFVQNGAGVVEQLWQSYWRRVPRAQRPANIFQAITTHGIHATDKSRFAYNHVSSSTGEIKVGRFQPWAGHALGPRHGQEAALNELRDFEQDAQPFKRQSKLVPESGGSGSLPQIIDDLLNTDLNVSYITDPLDFQLAYFEKLIVNAVVNPLTTLFECANGELLKMPALHSLIASLLKEDTAVLKEHYFHHSALTPSQLLTVNTVLDLRRLEAVIVAILNLTRHNYSSMLQDFKLGKKSLELYYLNQYFVSLAEGGAPLNRNLVSLVQSKQDLQHYRNGFVGM